MTFDALIRGCATHVSRQLDTVMVLNLAGWMDWMDG